MFKHEYKFTNHSMLTRAEECTLVQNWQTNKCLRSRNKLISHNLKFIASVANSMHRKYNKTPVGDLTGYGVLGFIEGVDKFDTTLGNKLITYCVHNIRQNIARSVEDLEGVIRAPANQREDIRKKVKAKQELSYAEQVTMDNVNGTIRNDDLVGKDENNTMTIAELYSFVNHDASTDIDNIIHIDWRDKNLMRIIDELHEPDRGIIKAWAGLDGGVGMTLDAVATKIGLKSETVRNIKDEAIRKLRYTIENVEDRSDFV